MATEEIKFIAKPAGGVIALSRKLGLSRATVSLWKRVPPHHVLAVERLTGIRREVIRPDIYGELPATDADKMRREVDDFNRPDGQYVPETGAGK